MIKHGKQTKYGLRGWPKAVTLGVLIHFGFFLGAGALVVFRDAPRPVRSFEPPPVVSVPKMPLKKPQIRLCKASMPKPVVAIPSETPTIGPADMPAPAWNMAGVGDRLAIAGLGSRDALADLDFDDGVLGSAQTIGNDLEGTFYDFKRNRRGNYTGAGNNTYKVAIRKFLHRNWQSSVLSGFYRSPRKIYTTMIVVPPCSSAVAPVAFGEKDAAGRYWMIHYKGALVHREDITFRFRGSGDEVMAVRVDGQLVLAACWNTVQESTVGDLWASDSADSRKFYMGNDRAVVGNWITLEAGVPRKMEVVLGDNGGEACAMLAVEVKGVEYARNRQGGPILPAFKTAEPSHDLLDMIYKDLPIGEICLTNGPVFSDY